MAQDEARGQSVLPYYVDVTAREKLAETVRRHGRADGEVDAVEQRRKADHAGGAGADTPRL